MRQSERKEKAVKLPFLLSKYLTGLEKPTEEAFKDMVTYLVAMHYVFKMLEEGLITLEE